MKPEDFDAIEEQAVEVHDGHPVELVVAVRLDREESRLLTELAEAERADLPHTMRVPPTLRGGTVSASLALSFSRRGRAVETAVQFRIRSRASRLKCGPAWARETYEQVVENEVEAP